MIEVPPVIVAILEGREATKLAKSKNLPHKTPQFTITLEDGELWLSYDSGFDYSEDGFTFEKEWKLVLAET
jgi:hypothetical protein